MKLFWPGHFDATKMSSASSLFPPNRMYSNQPKTGANFKSTSGPTITNNSEIIEVNFRYTALIAMCLGFLFIWSTVVSMIFLKNNFDENLFMQEPIEIFRDQERIGRVMFSVGQEMLFTVDSLVSVQLNLTSPSALKESINFTWTLTDEEIMKVRNEVNKPISDLIYLLAAIESKLGLIRSNLSLQYDHPLNMINSYKLIFDIAEQYSIEKTLYNDRKIHDSRWHLMKSFAEIQNAPYSLFIKGMNRRFVELAYGTIYHIGPQLLNHTDTESEISNYFYYFYSSHELIENAFSWDSRIYHRYLELLKTKHSQVLFSNSKTNLYQQSGRQYTRFVTGVVAYLLHAKDVLNVSFEELLFQFTSENNIIFYVIIAFIYLFVLLVCAVFFILFIRNAKIKEENVPQSKGTINNISQYVTSNKWSPTLLSMPRPNGA